MLKKAFLTLMVLSLSKAAFASSLSLSVSGGWNNPTPPNSSTLCVDIDNQAGQATDEVRWNGEQLLSGFDENAGDWALQGDACGAGSGADQYATLVSGYNFTPTSDSSAEESGVHCKCVVARSNPGASVRHVRARRSRIRSSPWSLNARAVS